MTPGCGGSWDSRVVDPRVTTTQEPPCPGQSSCHFTHECDLPQQDLGERARPSPGHTLWPWWQRSAVSVGCGRHSQPVPPWPDETRIAHRPRDEARAGRPRLPPSSLGSPQPSTSRPVSVLCPSPSQPSGCTVDPTSSCEEPPVTPRVGVRAQLCTPSALGAPHQSTRAPGLGELSVEPWHRTPDKCSLRAGTGREWRSSDLADTPPALWSPHTRSARRKYKG